MTTITVPSRLFAPVTTHPARRGLLIGFASTLTLGVLLTAAVSVAIGVMAANSILPGITVGGVELGGLGQAAATERLEASLPSLSSGQATLEVDGEETVVPYADVGRRHDLEAMVDAAFGIGRDPNPLLAGLDRLRNLAAPATLPVLVHAFDAGALDAAAADVADRFTLEPVEAKVTSEGATFTVSPSAPGRRLEAADVRGPLAAALSTTDPADVTISLTAEAVAPAVSTEDAEAVATAARETAVALPFEIPGAAADEEAPSLTAETIASWLSFGPGNDGDTYTLHIDEAAVTASVEGLVEAVDREPVNARITVAAGGGLAGYVGDAAGRALQVDESTRDLLRALESRASGATVGSLALAVDVTQAAFTTADAEALLPRMQLVSSWTTHYVPGEGNGWGANINIGAFDIDGRNLYPGEWFSFWGSIGPVTVERGYSYGGAIINGRSTQGVAIGGGICSTSTTIFNAALRAGLEMGDRLNHFYYIDRYPDGLDATVSIMDGWTQDMTFRNDTEHPIVIRGFGGNGSVTFQIWSAPMGRTVVITDPVTSNHRRASDTTVVDASMAPGTSRRVEFPHDGHDVWRSRYVYDANGNLLHQNDYFSSYATVTGIVAVGPGAPPEPPAEETAAADVAGGAEGGEPTP
jgi:vancomycin resistance protein YoaR